MTEKVVVSEMRALKLSAAIIALMALASCVDVADQLYILFLIIDQSPFAEAV